MSMVSLTQYFQLLSSLKLVSGVRHETSLAVECFTVLVRLENVIVRLKIRNV